MDSLIYFKDIEKQFGKTSVLKGINLEIKKGEIFGLLGVNGAGKTTLMRCLLGFLNMKRGALLFENRPLESKDIQEHFGFLPENFLPPQNLKAVEFLNILQWGLSAKSHSANSLLELVGLKEHRNKYIRTYSRGMIQRLGLASSLLKDPSVVILDEPTLGLDPLGQQQILKLLLTLNKDGKTIFFSSHILSQIEKVCTRIGIIHSGLIAFVGTVDEIIKKYNASSLEEAFLREINSRETNECCIDS